MGRHAPVRGGEARKNRPVGFTFERPARRLHHHKRRRRAQRLFLLARNRSRHLDGLSGRVLKLRCGGGPGRAGYDTPCLWRRHRVAPSETLGSGRVVVLAVAAVVAVSRSCGPGGDQLRRPAAAGGGGSGGVRAAATGRAGGASRANRACGTGGGGGGGGHVPGSAARGASGHTSWSCDGRAPASTRQRPTDGGTCCCGCGTGPNNSARGHSASFNGAIITAGALSGACSGSCSCSCACSYPCSCPSSSSCP